MPFKFSPGHCAPGDCGCGVTCPTCPSRTLPLPYHFVLTWTNILSGGGSTDLDYVSGCTWETPCFGGTLRAFMDLSGATAVFTIERFTAGTGCTALVATCSTSDGTLTALLAQCEPFNFSWKPTVGMCGGVSGAGYTSFTVTGI